MGAIKKFIAGELSGWHSGETIYLIICTAAIAGIAAFLGDTPYGIASAIAGTLYTLLAGKGKISCYFFGIINTVTYGHIAQMQSLYGDMMLNWFVYLPMMFAGIIMWRHSRDSRNCIIKAALSRRNRIRLLLLNIAGIALYALILQRMGGSQPVIDAATTVLSISAMILTLKRCIEQWLLWITVNLLSVGMWLRVYLASGASPAILLWWSIMLLTGVIFFIQWHNSMRDCRGKSQSASGAPAEINS